MDWLQKVLHDTARAALAEALAARGLDARCRDVSGMTGAFLAGPAPVVAFLAGSACRSTDPADPITAPRRSSALRRL